MTLSGSVLGWFWHYPKSSVKAGSGTRYSVLFLAVFLTGAGSS